MNEVGWCQRYKPYLELYKWLKFKIIGLLKYILFVNEN